MIKLISSVSTNTLWAYVSFHIRKEMLIECKFNLQYMQLGLQLIYSN